MGDQHPGRSGVGAVEKFPERFRLGAGALRGGEKGIQWGKGFDGSQVQQAGGVQASTPATGPHSGSGDAVAAERRPDCPGLLSPRCRQVALRRAIRHVEVRRVTTARRQRVTEEADRRAGTQRLPQVRRPTPGNRMPGRVRFLAGSARMGVSGNQP